MSRFVVFFCALILTAANAARPAIAEEAKSAQFPRKQQEAAAQVTATFVEYLAGDAREPRFPKSVRLTVADSRRAAQVIGGGRLFDMQWYVSQLASKGVERLAVRLAFPMLTPVARPQPQFEHFYRELASSVRQHDMELIVVLGNQAYDASYLRGFPQQTECTPDLPGRLATVAYAAEKLLAADYYIVDLRPKTLAFARGCAESANPIRAFGLTTAAIEKFREVLPDARLGVMVDLTMDNGYREAVMAADGDHFVAASTLNEPLDVAATLNGLAVLRKEADEAGREVAIGEWWLRKARASAEEAPSAVPTDSASLWRDADAWFAHYGASLETSGEVLFTVTHETDLMHGGYLDADQYVGPDANNPFNIAPELALGDRTRIRLNARKYRREVQRSLQESQAAAAGSR